MVVYGTPKGGATKTMKMLLHACCGPCSLEPVRLLSERGCNMVIAYANANIAPRDEYDRRFSELRKFADSQGIRVLEGIYDPAEWEKSAGVIGESLAGKCDISDFTRDVDTVSELLDDEHRQARCRACYRQRLEEAARMAIDAGCDTLSTTLAVSPYQFTEVIREELERAAANAGLNSYFEDWRPYYDNATARSREMGMYRQNYCGCRFSIAEGEATRAFIKHRNAQRKLQKQRETATERAAQEQQRKARAAERTAYNKKQERKRAILKAMREENKQQADQGQP